MAETTAGRMQTDLKPNSLGLLGVTMQAITHIAPAIAALFFTQFLVTLAGVTAPLAYVAAVVLVLMLGNTLIQLSKALPSAGGYYTYVSRALGARLGFLTSWMFILAVQGLTGWEAAAPLAEETQDPKTNTPRSVLLSIVILGVFLVFTYWGVITGFGVDNIKGIQNSPDLPGLALAHDKWGAGWW